MSIVLANIKYLYTSYALLAVLIGSVWTGTSEAQPSAIEKQPRHLITHLSNASAQSSSFEDIKKRGRLRIIMPSNIGGGGYLPRSGSPVSQQNNIAEAFARNHNLTPELIIVDSFGEMIPALREGKGDIIVANLTVTDTRRKHIEFSVPLAHVHEQLLVRKTDNSIRNVSDLNHKRVMVSHASTFWDALLWLKEHKYKDIELVPRPKGLVDEDEIDLLVKGEIDATIRDSNIADMYLGYRDDFKVATNFSAQRDIAWGVRKEAPGLLLALNQYLQLEHLADAENTLHKDDFEQIKKRKVLRVLLRNNASSYFLYKGELLGFEYEMVRKFARSHGLRLEVIVPPTHRELLSWLVEGRADLALGFLEPSDERQALGITFSTPYNREAQHVVIHKDDALPDLESLTKREVTVRASSSYWKALQRLKKQGYAVTARAAPESIETEELIRQVGKKNIEATLADAHILDIELAKAVPVKSAFPLGEERPQAVAVRQPNTQLVAAVNAFINKTHRSKFYNVLYNKYFKSRKSINRLAKGRIDTIGKNQLSPWDETTRKYAEKYGFDWRLITAQMYQESRFNPNAKSFAGASGLMQLMPRTAKAVGVKDISNPEKNIRGGVKYMDWLRDRFDDELPVSVKLWFTLAAYNAGHGHVRDAQRLARQKGWNDRRWFNHTEKAMLLLSKKAYSSKARYGYVDGEEPVKYVREIKSRFEAYVNLKLESEQPVLSFNQHRLNTLF